MTSTSGIDGDAVPARRVEQHHTRWDPDPEPARLEQQIETAVSVNGRLVTLGRRSGPSLTDLERPARPAGSP